MKMKNLALAWKKVVLDAEPLHGFEVATQHSCGDQVADLRRVVPAMLDGVQGLQTQGLTLGHSIRVGRVPLRDAGVKIPAVVVDALSPLSEIGKQLTGAGEIHLFQ